MGWSYYPSSTAGNILLPLFHRLLQHFNSLRKSQKLVQPRCVTTQLHPGADIKPALQSMGFPGSFIQDGGSSLLLHVCASVSGLNPVSDFTVNKFARPQLRALALAWSQLPSAQGGFGGESGWALSLCQACLWPWRQWQWPEGIVHAGEVMIILFPRQGSLSAGIMQYSCIVPLHSRGAQLGWSSVLTQFLFVFSFPASNNHRAIPHPGCLPLWWGLHH